MVKGGTETETWPIEGVHTNKNSTRMLGTLFLVWKIGLPKDEIMGWSCSGSLRLMWYGILGFRGALRSSLTPTS